MPAYVTANYVIMVYVITVEARLCGLITEDSTWTI